MLPKSLLVFAAAAATALVVPEISEPGEGIFKALPYPTDASVLPVTPLSESVSVPCLKCKGKGSHLDLNFAVEDGTKLMVNGFELYPNADLRHGDIMAAVVKAHGKEKEKKLGFSLAVELMGVDEEQQLQLVGIELRILQIGTHFVKGIPAVQVKLVKDRNQKIALGSITVQEASEVGCNSMLCRVQEMAAEVFKALKGCVGNRHKGYKGHKDHKGHKGHKGHSAPKKDEDTKADPNVPISGDDADRQPKKHHGHRHNWRHLLKNIATHIFLPVLMGITAGVGVAVFAMVLCTIVIRLTGFIRNRRSQGARCRRSKKQAVHEAGADVEKVGLMEAAHEEPPPQYPDDASKN